MQQRTNYDAKSPNGEPIFPSLRLHYTSGRAGWWCNSTVMGERFCLLKFRAIGCGEEANALHVDVNLLPTSQLLYWFFTKPGIFVPHPSQLKVTRFGAEWRHVSGTVFSSGWFQVFCFYNGVFQLRRRRWWWWWGKKGARDSKNARWQKRFSGTSNPDFFAIHYAMICALCWWLKWKCYETPSQLLIWLSKRVFKFLIVVDSSFSDPKMFLFLKNSLGAQEVCRIIALRARRSNHSKYLKHYIWYIRLCTLHAPSPHNTSTEPRQFIQK